MKTRGKNFFFTSDFYGAGNVLADSFDRLQLGVESEVNFKNWKEVCRFSTSFVGLG